MNNSQRVRVILYSVISVLLLTASIYVLPNNDDWFIFRKFGKTFSENWPEIFNSYQSYWRPVENLFSFIVVAFPLSFPYLNHVVVIVFHLLSALVLSKLSGVFIKNNNLKDLITIAFILNPMSMASVFSIDATAQVLATFSGLAATLIFFKYKGFFRYFIWILLTLLATFSKETGIVWFVATPLLYFLNQLVNNPGGKISLNRELIFNLIMGAFVVLCYFIARYSFYPESFVIAQTNSPDSYVLTPDVFVKNILILFFAPIFSIDTTAIIYDKNILLSLITILLNLPWIYVLFRLIRNYLQNKTHFLVLGLMLIIVVVASSPSLLTRAGELSPHPVIPLLTLFLGIILAEFKEKLRFSKITLVLFFISLMIVDIHKYILIYQAGKVGNDIAIELKEKTKVNPENVLLLIVDNYSELKHGAFHPVAGRSFHEGDAAFWLYKYKYPKHKKVVMIKPQNNIDINKQVEDSVKFHNKGFDCVWIVNNMEVQVINNNQN